jgi:hypothetical protein
VQHHEKSIDSVTLAGRPDLCPQLTCQHAAAQCLTKSQLEQRLAAFPNYSLYLQALQAVPDLRPGWATLITKR